MFVTGSTDNEEHAKQKGKSRQSTLITYSDQQLIAPKGKNAYSAAANVYSYVNRGSKVNCIV
jgi:hypothetical protein